MSIVLNGSTQYAYILEALTAGRPATIAGWFKSSSDSAAQCIASLAYKDGSVDYRVLGAAGHLTGDPVIAHERHGGVYPIAETATGYTTNIWTHALAEFISHASRKALIDGGSEGTDTVGVSPADLDKTAIGVICRQSLVWFFSGKLGEIAMWDVILTSQQKTDLANGADPSTVDPTNLLAYYSLRENANDGSGNNKHLTTVGSPSFDTEDHPEIEEEDFVGSAEGQGGANGSLDSQSKLVGSIIGVSGVNGSLNVVYLVSSAEGQGGADGSLDSQSGLEGSAIGISEAVGSFNIIIDLVSSIVEVTGANGSLDFVAIRLTSSAAGILSVEGFLNIQLKFIGSAAGISGTSGSLYSLLKGSTVGISGISGSLYSLLKGLAVGISNTEGFLNIQLCSVGFTAGAGGASGFLNILLELYGSIAGILSVEGSLFSLLKSSVSGLSGISGSLRIHNYLLDEQSAIYGQPIELYLFNRDDIEYWRYTSSDSIIVYEGESYLPVLIRRGDIALDSNSLKTRVEIETDLSNLFVRNFISEPLEGRISLIIYRSHFNSYVTYWKGYVQGVKFKSKTAKILTGLKNASLKRFGLMRKFQRSCGLPLYSKWCTILKSNVNFYKDGTINLVDGRTIDATIFGTKSDGWFKGGIFKTDNGSCLQKIVYHVGNEIKITRPIAALAAGDTFRAWAGCDHLKSTCNSKFGNKLNYGGQPYLPDKNPFIGDAVM